MFYSSYCKLSLFAQHVVPRCSTRWATWTNAFSNLDSFVGQSGAKEKLVPNVVDLAFYTAFALAEYGGVAALTLGDEACALAEAYFCLCL